MTNIELKETRQKLGLTQSKLAKLLFRTTDCIAKWESGKYPIPKQIHLLIKGITHEHYLEANR
jgi:DNA-binding transcriptional regulator YiaG